MSNVEQYNCSIDVLGALLWQDNDAVNLSGLLNAKQAWYQENHCDFWNDWVVNVFDLNTANEFGLRVWSEILNVPLFASTERSPNEFPAWGFGDINFTHGNFATDDNSAFLLTLEERRIVLKMRFFSLVTSGALTQVNSFMASIFGVGNFYMIDNNDMTITYTNTIELSSELTRTLIELDLLPRPSGVRLIYINAA